MTEQLNSLTRLIPIDMPNGKWDQSFQRLLNVHLLFIGTMLQHSCICFTS